MLKTGTTIIPIFYHVDPSVLKWIARRVDESAQGISEHEKKGRYIPEKFIPEKLQKWLKALYDVYLRWFPSKVDKSALEKRIYVDAFSQHKEKDRYTPEKLQEWMKALHDVSFVSGYMIKDDSEDEGEVLENVVRCVEKAMKSVRFEVLNILLEWMRL
ncbi:hypothetical protein SUGI_0686660 [Cryptomeria japonica]|nr:hypothetical protein SUGI_0686660 [Cryptomeria japonica]